MTAHTIISTKAKTYYAILNDLHIYFQYVNKNNSECPSIETPF